MLGSSILEVVIAMVFLFLSVSLAAGAAVEAVASILNLRPATLQKGVMQILNDPDFNDLAAELYAHALISPRGPGLSGMAGAPATPPATLPSTGTLTVSPVRAILNPPTADAGEKQQKKQLRSHLGRNRPAYIAPKQFANALTDILALVPATGDVPTVADLQAAVDRRLPIASYPQLNQLLHGMIVRTSGDLKAMKIELCSWFDNAMDRLSGAYKRHTQLYTFIAALLISMSVNADAIHLARRVWAQPTLLASLATTTTAKDTIEHNRAYAESLPFGWAQDRFWSIPTPDGGAETLGGRALVTAILGWLITSLATLFGAPFWFDTLQRVTRLKGAGPSPEEKREDMAAAS